MRIRQGKTAAPTKHLQKSVGSSRRRNDKRIANKVIRAAGKIQLKNLHSQ